jgi:hypothetical protein
MQVQAMHRREQRNLGPISAAVAMNLDDYVDVPARIAEFRGKYPDGSLQPADLAKPYSVEVIDGQTCIVVVAAAYRDREDTRPGVGMAQEAFPGKTPYTRGSELQNAETSAWGRAIVAALAADTKRSVASREEVRNRQAERDEPLRRDWLRDITRVKDIAALEQLYNECKEAREYSPGIEAAIKVRKAELEAPTEDPWAKPAATKDVEDVELPL